MKKNLLLPILTAVVCAVAFTSCDDDDYYYGYDTYYDRDLPGQWDLLTINGRFVYDDEKNFFDFYTNGSGKYYYYKNGNQYWEWIDWYCYYDYSTPVLHIKYSDGVPLDCAYHFNSNASRLYLQWTEADGYRMEYVYEYTGPAEAKRREVEKIMRGTAADSGSSLKAASSLPRPGQSVETPAAR